MKPNRIPPKGSVIRFRVRGNNLREQLVSRFGDIVQVENQLERQLVLIIDRNPTVVRYSGKPHAFEYFDLAGKPCVHYPSLMVWRCDGRVEIHDVVYTRDLNQPASLHRRKAVDAICMVMGWHYIVHPEQTLPGTTEYANLLFLYQYRPTCYFNQKIFDEAVELLAAGRLSVHTLIPRIAHQLEMPDGRVMSTLFHFLWLGQLSTDLRQLIIINGDINSKMIIWKQTEV